MVFIIFKNNVLILYLLFDNGEYRIEEAIVKCSVARIIKGTDADG